jgi:hypothetical protein
MGDYFVLKFQLFSPVPSAKEQNYLEHQTNPIQASDN